MLDLTMIVLNYNSEKDTVNCVESLIKLENSFNIVIVDNCSSDDSFFRLNKRYEKFSNVNVIKSECNGGYSAGNNYGMKYAIEKYCAKYLGIINPDVIINDKELIPKLIHYMEIYSDCVVIGGATQDPNGRFDINKAAWNVPTVFELIIDHLLFIKRKKSLNSSYISEHLMKVDCVAGCFFLTKTDFMTNIKFLDESVFLYNEENILGIKCKLYGKYEAIYTKGFYIHNHMQKHIEMPLKRKVLATKNAYESSKTLIKKYYSIIFVPFLTFAEILNRGYLLLAFFYGKIKDIFSIKDFKLIKK